MIRIVLATLLISAQPATAHCYSVWRYKTPQHGCTVTRVALHAPAPDRSYFVEITTPPPAPVAKPIPLPAVENIAEPDPRTLEQIADQKEHDAAVAAHKGEINKLMILLHAEEDAANAAGIETK